MKKTLLVIIFSILALVGISEAKAYFVKPGDTLCGIAKTFGISCGQIIVQNPQIENPDVIYPKEEISISEDYLVDVYDILSPLGSLGGVVPVRPTEFKTSLNEQKT